MGSQIVGCRPSTKSLDLSEMSSWPDLFEAELLLLEKMGCSAKSHEAIKSIRPDGAASARKSCCVRLIRAISFQKRGTYSQKKDERSCKDRESLQHLIQPTSFPRDPKRPPPTPRNVPSSSIKRIARSSLSRNELPHCDFIFQCCQNR